MANSSKNPTDQALDAARAAVGANDVADPTPVPGAPDSILGKTSTTSDECDALRSTSYATVNLSELEEKIGLVARIILEHALRTKGGLTKKDKCDIALRAITTLEGQKREVIWRDKRLKAPERKTMAAYTEEKKRVADKLIKAAIREKELRVSELESAETALEAIGEPPEGTQVN